MKGDEKVEYHIGMIVDGVITGVQPYGVFVGLDDDTQGLIHISEIRHGYIKNIRDTLHIGDPIRVQIIDIDEYSHKMSLSTRTLEHKIPYRYVHKQYFTNRHRHIGFKSIGDRLEKWTQLALNDLKQTNND